MAKYDLTLSARQYDADMGWLRKAIVLDRKPQLAEVVVRTEYGFSVRIMVDHNTLYTIAIDFGAGLWRFPDTGFPPVPGAKVFEFGSNYNDLGLHLKPVVLSAGTLHTAVEQLSYHKPGKKGSDFLWSEKQDLIRIVFTVSEALRFWTVQRDVSNLLKSPGTTLVINDYAGNGKPLNSWETWSGGSTWADKGVFVPKV